MVHRCELTGRFWNIETETDVTLTRKMVHLVGLCFQQDAPNRCRVIEVRIVEEKSLFIDLFILEQRF